MNKADTRPRSDEMYEAILTLKTLEECKQFFEDLCSVSELSAMEQRFGVAVRRQKILPPDKRTGKE